MNSSTPQIGSNKRGFSFRQTKELYYYIVVTNSPYSVKHSLENLMHHWIIEAFRFVECIVQRTRLERLSLMLQLIIYLSKAIMKLSSFYFSMNTQFVR